MFNAMLLLQAPCRNRMEKPGGKGDGCHLQTLLTHRSQCGRADIMQHLEWWCLRQFQICKSFTSVSLTVWRIRMHKAIVLNCTTPDFFNWHWGSCHQLCFSSFEIYDSQPKIIQLKWSLHPLRGVKWELQTDLEPGNYLSPDSPFAKVWQVVQASKQHAPGTMAYTAVGKKWIRLSLQILRFDDQPNPICPVCKPSGVSK